MLEKKENALNFGLWFSVVTMQTLNFKLLFLYCWCLADVLGEDAIIQWYKTEHTPKGKSVFLNQMEKMVTWLQNAEEESSEEEDEEEGE